MRRLILTLMLLALAGCASLAPERERPAMPVPGDWSERAGLDATGSGLDALGWRDAFPDPALQELIGTALTENRNLRQAILAIDKGRAQAGVSRADRFPSINAQGQNSNQHLPTEMNGGLDTINRSWNANLGVSAFELDFFGRLRSLETKALEEYLATEEARRAVHIALVTQVARTYLTLASDREALTLTRETRASREATLRLTESRVKNGLGSDLERYQAEEAVAVTQSEEARLVAQIAMDENALAVLTGRPVRDLNLPARAINDIPPGAPVTPGLSSDLLQRRPDILEAEHRLWAAGAQIGAARAMFFPRIGLTGSTGFASLELTDLFDATAHTWLFMPSVSLPIFDAGRNKANLEIAEAEREIRIAAYEAAIKNAFREVADALAKARGYDGQVQALIRRVDSSAQSRILVDQRYLAGLESAFALHDAERTLFSARLILLNARLAQRLTAVELFSALGGGWQEQGTHVAANQ
jgi:multidrug efflux system outer membrane protein